MKPTVAALYFVITLSNYAEFSAVLLTCVGTLLGI
jgi:hypothetical protein